MAMWPEFQQIMLRLLCPCFGGQIAAPLQQVEHVDKSGVFYRLGERLHGKLPQHMRPQGVLQLGKAQHKLIDQPDQLRRGALQ